MENQKRKLNILIFTQKANQDDDVLGAFYYWFEKMAQKAGRLYIVCLFEGKHSLPSNVQVFSLGKEKGRSRIKYIFRVYKYFWRLRKKIDVMFVHMNEVYIFLLWPLAKIYKIPIVFWKAHGGKLPYAKKAIFMSDKIVTSGEKTFEYNTPKKHIIGQGVNIDFFKRTPQPETGLFEVLAVGRPGPIKHYDILIETANILIHQRNRKNFVFRIVGSPQFVKEQEHQKTLQDKIQGYNLTNFFIMERGVAFAEIKEKYQKCSCLVNLTFPASLEKVALEAMAMEKPVITSNEAFFSFFAGMEFLKVKLNDPCDLADKIEKLAQMPEQERRACGQKLREIVVKEHSVDHLIDNLMDVFYSVARL